MKLLQSPLLYFATILIVSSLVLACREMNPPEPPVSMQAIWDCYQSSNLDSLALRNALLGEWEWEYVECYWAPEEASNISSHGVSIYFDANGRLAVKLDNTFLESATWELKKGDSGLFELISEPRITYLYGRVLLCEDRVLFNDSYVDDCDNYFKRN
ncbi:MAG: hypothetical protein AB8H47_18930 [Bacteroidia bacterium]